MVPETPVVPKAPEMPEVFSAFTALKASDPVPACNTSLFANPAISELLAFSELSELLVNPVLKDLLGDVGIASLIDQNFVFPTEYFCPNGITGDSLTGLGSEPTPDDSPLITLDPKAKCKWFLVGGHWILMAPSRDRYERREIDVLLHPGDDMWKNVPKELRELWEPYITTDYHRDRCDTIQSYKGSAR